MCWLQEMHVGAQDAYFPSQSFAQGREGQSQSHQSINQSINQSCISGLFHSILLPDHSWQIIEINQGQT